MSENFHQAVAARLKRPEDTHRYPDFWSDNEVRATLIDLHREVQIGQARDILIGRFGADRTPSITAIHRFWQRLDELRYRRGATTAPERHTDLHALVAARFKQPGEGHKYPNFGGTPRSAQH